MRALMLLLLGLLLAGCAEVSHQESEVNVNINETEILKIAGVENGSVEELTPQNLVELAKKYPVIYGSLPNKTLYQIKTENTLIIVDAEEKKVLRKFRFIGINLGG